MKDVTLTTSSYKSNDDISSPKGPIEYPPSLSSSVNSTPANSDSTGKLLGPPFTNQLKKSHEVDVNSHHSKNFSSVKEQVSVLLYIKKKHVTLFT